MKGSTIMNPLFVSYEQFGAKGDGVTDDFDAIVACHDYANANNIPVKATDGATYYISGKAQHATIKTNVDFGEAKFIIDDRAVENRNEHIFVIDTDFETFPVDIKQLKKTDKKIDFPHEGKVLVCVTDGNHNIFIREGLNMNNGVPQHEYFIVDESGNIETTLNWDYENVTSAKARRVDDEPITVRGGIFTTIANQAESFYTYYARNIEVRRANVTVCDMKHYVEGELDHGAPYVSFFAFEETYNATFKNILMTPRFIYWTPSKVPGKDVPMGSYDIGGGNSVKISLIGIRQTIDIMDRRYWGLIGTNYCKEFYLDDCVMSRFDAHQGATDVVIKNSTFGHQCLSLIGHGHCEIENTTVFGWAFITLRGDYGCHWDGSISIKNCAWKPASIDRDLWVIYAHNRGLHNFGYTAKMPERIDIDGLEILDEGAENTFGAYILPDYSDLTDEQRPYAYVPTKAISHTGVVARSGRKVDTLKTAALFPDIQIDA